MMTLGLNRPVFSFGLLVVSTFFPHGDIRCDAEVEDLRTMEVPAFDILSAKDNREMEFYLPFDMRVVDNRVMMESRTHIAKAEDVRIFEVASNRYFEDEEDTRTFIVELECEDDDIQSN